MEKFQLSVLFKIIGIGSASGLLLHNNILYLISDNSTYLYEYHIDHKKLNKIPLLENAQENIAKKDKPDFEVLTKNKEYIIAMGSGSEKYRTSFMLYNPETKKTIVRNIAKLDSLIKTQLSIKDDEFNIEGYFINDKASYFFNRGNGQTGKNAVFYTDNKTKIPQYQYIPFDLPKIKNVPTTFTDAILVDDKIYFLAAAEDTVSTYEDGEVLGSIIGRIDLKTMKLEKTIQISDKHKFEGLTLHKKTTGQIEFLLCEDTDSDLQETNIYKLVIRD